MERNGLVKLPDNFESQREAFLENLKFQGCSPCTLKTYGDSLEVLFRFFIGLKLQDTREVEDQDVRQYQVWLTAQDYSGWTVLTRLQAMRRFFEFLESTDQILLDPCTNLPAPKLPKRLPKQVLSVSEAHAVLKAPNGQSGKAIRDRAILEVFYSTGIRLQEMAHLKVEDVDCTQSVVRVWQGKGARDRMVPLGRKACDSVAEYLKKVRAAWAKAGTTTAPYGSAPPSPMVH